MLRVIAHVADPRADSAVALAAAAALPAADVPHRAAKGVVVALFDYTTLALQPWLASPDRSSEDVAEALRGEQVGAAGVVGLAARGEEAAPFGVASLRGC